MLTDTQSQSITDLLASCHLTKGIGTSKENACSIAAINLALTGRLADDIPPCMSEVIGKWIIGVQDAMPDDMRNSADWKRLLPLAAGTGRDKETERFDIIKNWMWGTVLPYLQPIANKSGYGDKWRVMCEDRTKDAANAADDAATAAAAIRAANCATAAACAAASSSNAWSACAAAAAAGAAANCATAAAADDAYAATAASYSNVWAAYAADDAAAYAATAAYYSKAWAAFAPCSLLETLINA